MLDVKFSQRHFIISNLKIEGGKGKVLSDGDLEHIKEGHDILGSY